MLLVSQSNRYTATPYTSPQNATQGDNNDGEVSLDNSIPKGRDCEVCSGLALMSPGWGAV